ncbi:CPBP family intramembrane glutamic endopeptidase [Modestobacter sp. Leaf380]|uniref:CPBP family intramembrane glutamic endopeptidase n=1 Tax=Modestobacter sp. Leaf380 TaxID=1736356 RepID=UPI0006FAC112|nr:CPBP family intramembrane glutamic endopeptidase [Modestobacter sp. Leaf380]KQS64870.1 abortive infection protein [Modestobacter sp. Leaf380]
MTGLPDSLADFGPAQLAAVVIAGYLVVGEPFVGHVLHRRFEDRMRTDARARRSFYRRLLVLEWGLALLVLVVFLAAPDVDGGQLGLRWPQQWPGVVTTLACLLLVGFVGVSTRALRSGALATAPPPRPRPGEGRHSEPPVQSTVALLPRSVPERRLFALVGVTAGVCEEWLYRGFFLAVVAAVAPTLPTGGLVVVAAVAFGLAHAYQGMAGVLTTGVLGGVLAALYLQTGSLLLPVLLHAVIDLRFLLVPATALPAVRTAR